jgi:hypothetical protein
VDSLSSCGFTMKTYTFSEDCVRGSAMNHMVACMFRSICGFEVIEQYRTGTRSSIDGTKITVDGYISPCGVWPKGLCYECKSQNVGGTAHKRLPYYLVDVKAKLYPAPLLFIVDGEFYAKFNAGKKAFQWMKGQVDGEHVFDVMNYSEFVSWCQRSKGSPNR